MSQNECLFPLSLNIRNLKLKWKQQTINATINSTINFIEEMICGQLEKNPLNTLALFKICQSIS